MSLRKIEYMVSKDNISPKTEQSAGLQGENLVTNVVFKVDEELLAEVGALEGETVFRVQTTDGAGGFHSSEFFILDSQNSTITFPITADISNAGGVAFLHLVISKLIDGKPEQILYSFPARLKFTDTSGGTASEKEYLQNINNTLARSLKAEETATEAAKKAETAKDIALTAKDTAVMVAKESKEYAESAKAAETTAKNFASEVTAAMNAAGEASASAIGAAGNAEIYANQAKTAMNDAKEAAGTAQSAAGGATVQKQFAEEAKQAAEEAAHTAQSAETGANVAAAEAKQSAEYTINYVDTAIGEIDTALDGIIAIQNSLIGGEGV